MPKQTIENLIALTIPEVQKIFLEVMQDIADRAMLNEMVAAIEAGDVEALYRASGFSPAALTPIIDRIERAYLESAGVTADGFPRRIKTPIGTVVFRFNGRNPRVEEDLRKNSSVLISRLTEEIRDNVRVSLERGMIEGQNPRSTALDIIGRVDPRTKQRVGGVIGLTPSQERWVANARRYLAEGDEKYFALGLRDKRFDKTIMKHFENGKPVPMETMDKAILSYKNRALKYRAEAIARTETIQSMNRGEYMAHMQAVESGVLDRNNLTKYWDAVGDLKTRHTHFELEQRTKKKPLSIDEPFVSTSGSRMMFPGDSSLDADAAEIVNCRCRVVYKVNWLAGVD